MNNRNWFLTVLEAGKPSMKAPADPVSADGLFPGLQVARLLTVSSHGRETGSKLPHVSSYKDINPIHECSTLLPWSPPKGPTY